MTMSAILKHTINKSFFLSAYKFPPSEPTQETWLDCLYSLTQALSAPTNAQEPNLYSALPLFLVNAPHILKSPLVLETAFLVSNIYVYHELQNLIKR